MFQDSAEDLHNLKQVFKSSKQILKSLNEFQAVLKSLTDSLWWVLQSFMQVYKS